MSKRERSFSIGDSSNGFGHDRQKLQRVHLEAVAESEPESKLKSKESSDVYSRVGVTKNEGRGSLTGWTVCPLCNKNKSSKKYALGRGISMHLQQVHTPWNPGKAELARRKRIRRRVQGIAYRKFKGDADFDSAVQIDCQDELALLADRKMNVNEDSTHTSSDITQRNENETQQDYKERLLQYVLGSVWNRDDKYEPTLDESKRWAKRLVDLGKQLEEAYEASKSNQEKRCADADAGTDTTPNHSEDKQFIQAGLDRTGNKSNNYRDSLPPFIKAAADGNLTLLQHMVKEAESKYETGKDPIRQLLEAKDRNSSCAEDWAAGNGHLDCLKYLMKIYSLHLSSSSAATSISMSNKTTSKRKRDGKSSLHYASRNGHLHVIQFLVDPTTSFITTMGMGTRTCAARDITRVGTKRNISTMEVDVTSGDGTTPLHLACYGGHFKVIQYLIEHAKADIYRENDWGCGIGHWIAMSIQPDHDKLKQILEYVKKLVGGRSFEVFGRQQKQGHSSIHKAAQKLNQRVVEWLVSEFITNAMNLEVETRVTYWTDKQRCEAGARDKGGNKPSDIWLQMGGSETFSTWMKNCDL